MASALEKFEEQAQSLIEAAEADALAAVEAIQKRAADARETIAAAAKFVAEADERESAIAAEQKAIKELRDNAARLENEAAKLLGIKATARRSTTGRRSGVAFNQSAVLDYVNNASEPVGASAFKHLAGELSGATLSINLKRLVDDGLLTKQGEKRGTKYTITPKGRKAIT